MVQTLNTGAVASVTGVFTDEAGALVNPTVVDLLAVAPDGSEVVTHIGSLVHQSTGVFTFLVLLDQEGLWSFRWESSGPTSVSQTSVLALGLVGADLPVSLVTEAQYRQATNDNDTLSSDVLYHLVEAQSLVEEYLRRQLTSMERTEPAPIWSDPTSGRTYVYPLATPITAIPASATYTVQFEGAALGGVASTEVDWGWWGWSWAYGGLFFSSDAPPPLATIVYTGGYTSATLPVTLRRAIARVALALSRVTPAATLVAGAASLRVGDVSITKPGGGAADATELDTLVPGISATLRKWRRRTVRY